MAFNEQPPEWNAQGTEPPQTKKDQGWLENDHPPADWWNWFKYRTYKVLQELQAHQHTGAAGDAPKLTSSAFAPGAVDDAAFGNRTVDDTATPNTGPSTITNLFSFFGKMIRLTTGEASWITAPAMTIKAIVTALGSLAALLTTAKTSLVSAINELFNTTPKKTTANLTYYVNAATGNDSNDGLTAGTPLRNIQTAINRIPQIVNHGVVINIAPGAYAEDVVISGFSGKANILIVGGATNAASTNYTVQSLFILENQTQISVVGLAFTTTTGDAVKIESSVYSLIKSCSITGVATSYNGISVLRGGFSELQDITIANRQYAIRVGAAHVNSIANAGPGNTVGLLAESGGVISKNAGQPAGTTAEQTLAGGVIR